MTININPAHKGLLHTKLGVPQGKKIPEAKIVKAKHSPSPALRKEATFAQNFGKSAPAIPKAPKVLPKMTNNAPAGDNRAGRLTGVDTDRGAFRFKANRMGE